MKKAIVTGANGFVGSHLVNELIEKKVEVIAVVRNEKSNLHSIIDIDGVRIIYCDLSEIKHLSEKVADRDIDVFYHFAWHGSAGSDRTDERLQMQNALWTADCVRAASELGCKRFVGAGSIMEKEAMAAVYTKENRPGMSYIYGIGKLAANSISKSVAAQLNIEHMWGIITNAYGAGELSPRFINTTLRKIMKREQLNFTAAVQNYDFVYVTDVAKAFYLIGISGKPFCEYMIGSSAAKPLKEFIVELQETIAPDRELFFGSMPFTGVNLGLELFNTDEIEKDTGFKATVSFEEGVKLTMDWLKTKEGLS